MDSPNKGLAGLAQAAAKAAEQAKASQKRSNDSMRVVTKQGEEVDLNEKNRGTRNS